MPTNRPPRKRLGAKLRCERCKHMTAARNRYRGVPMCPPCKDDLIVAEAGPWVVHEFPDEEYTVVPGMSVEHGEDQRRFTERWLAACEALRRVANRLRGTNLKKEI